jgi:hypothetical protein
MTFVCGFVSAYDNALNFITIDVLKSVEQNPVALMVIENFDVHGLIFFKAFSTLIAVLLMIRLVYSRYRLAIVPVFIFQLWLFFYLSFYAEERFTSADAFEIPRMFFTFLAESYAV